VWSVATISETTQLAGAVNRLSIVLRPKVLFAIGDVIEVTGLIGTSIANTTALPLIGVSSTQLGSTGVWTQPDGRLVLTLTSVMPTTVDSIISIDLTNPTVYQTPRIPLIATLGSVPSQPIPMYGSALGGTCVQTCDNAAMAAVGMQSGSITDGHVSHPCIDHTSASHCRKVLKISSIIHSFFTFVSPDHCDNDARRHNET
jgi:hypothetical protein